MHFIVLSILLVPNLLLAQSLDEIDDLKKQVKELNELVSENSELIKRQLRDGHIDQNSRGYVEVKYGRSKLDPKDLNDENDDTFNGMNDASWEDFDYAHILDLEIGKTLFLSDSVKHEIGIGYQFLRSREVKASFTPNGGGSKVNVFETISFNTVFARYAALFNLNSSGNLYFGPGFTFGYSPESKILIQFEQDDEGVQLSGEGTSYLIEIFGKMKYEFSRYFNLVATAGYRLQEAENVRLTAAELVNIRTKTDIEVSGLFATVGLAVSF